MIPSRPWSGREERPQCEIARAPQHAEPSLSVGPRAGSIAVECAGVDDRELGIAAGLVGDAEPGKDLDRKLVGRSETKEGTSEIRFRREQLGADHRPADQPQYGGDRARPGSAAGPDEGDPFDGAVGGAGVGAVSVRSAPSAAPRSRRVTREGRDGFPNRPAPLDLGGGSFVVHRASSISSSWLRTR